MRTLGTLLIFVVSTGMPLLGQTKTDTLKPGDQLKAEQSIYSTDGKYEMRMQGDCNLVIYEKQPNDLPDFAVAYTDTQGLGFSNCYLIMQPDGNLVIYGYDRFNTKKPAWYSNTQKYPGSIAVLREKTGILDIANANGVVFTSKAFKVNHYQAKRPSN